MMQARASDFHLSTL